MLCIGLKIHKELKLFENYIELLLKMEFSKKHLFSIILPSYFVFQGFQILEDFYLREQNPQIPILSKWPMKASYMPKGILVILILQKTLPNSHTLQSGILHIFRKIYGPLNIPF